MSVERELREKLMIALEPIRLDIVNESELHAGHRNSPRFAGLSRVARHRLVNEALAGLVGGRVHALALSTHAPGEAIASA
jgi:BolA family transcriptional regulator, general stress-responsive regulator